MQIGDGETITRRPGRDLVLLAERPEIAITWTRYAPRERGPDPHVHREHTDAFYVLEGELTFALGPLAEPIRVPAGGFVAVPPNVAHTFANEGDADASFLNFHAPDTGFAAYLRALRDGTEPVFDQFDPPAGGGLPATGAIVTLEGEGERLPSGGLLKSSLPELSVAEWDVSRPLADVVEEAEHTFLEERRGAFVVVGQAAVGEQVSIAGVHEQLRALHRLVELPRGLEVFVRRQGQHVGVHHVHLERDALRPRAVELGGRDTGMQQHGSSGARTRLGQHLRRQHPE
jgi:quercetin dioxygenase-like cupin family protein